MVSSVRHDARIGSLGDAIAWLRARPWYYAYAVLALYGIVPGLRRVIDWRSSFSAVSVVSIVPLLALFPAVALLFTGGRLARLGRAPIVAGWLWAGAFTYAYAIGIVSGNLVPGTYTLIEFLLPACFGLYIATLEIPMVVLFEKISSFALALSVPISLYALYQVAFPPPWDLLWIQQTGFVSVGTAAAFGFRAFGTLNGPGPFADFLIGVLILNLPRLRHANPARIGAFAVTIGALAATLVRADWIALALAAIVFVGLSPRKLQNLSGLAVFGLVVTLLASNAAALSGNAPAGLEIQSRFESLTSIGTDKSFLDRQAFTERTLSSALSEPTGEGLGVVGTAAKLSSTEATLNYDNGYLARFTEMGYAGFAGYLATLVLMLVFTFGRWRAFERRGDRASASIAAAAVAMQVAFAFLDLSGDHHFQFTGMFCWLAFALAYVGIRGEEPAR